MDQKEQQLAVFYVVGLVAVPANLLLSMYAARRSCESSGVFLIYSEETTHPYPRYPSPLTRLGGAVSASEELERKRALRRVLPNIQRSRKRLLKGTNRQIKFSGGTSYSFV